MQASRSRRSGDGGDTAGADALTAVLELFASGALADAAGRFAADATYQEAGQAPIRGRDAIRARFDGFAASGVTWTFTVDEVIRNGLSACVVYRFAVFGGASESQRERAGCAVVRCESGHIVAWREYQG